ncbi:unnamed protein product [Tilletia caries]|nr:unnamed protein product [Tilletia caries]
MYAVAWLSYLILAQSDPPLRSSGNGASYLPFLPYSPMRCVKINWAASLGPGAYTRSRSSEQKPLLPKHIGQISAHTIARRASRTWSDDAQASSSRFRASSTVQTSRDLAFFFLTSSHRFQPQRNICR